MNQKKMYFCTLFDSFYLARGLAMYESLEKNCENFHLYVVAFDNIAERVLKKLAKPFMTVISLSEFEDERLLSIKSSRSKGEYCWTATPSVIRYCLDRFHLEYCIYVDADLYFYSDPGILRQEIGEHSVAITSHNYTPIYDQSVTSGIYCVQFVYFRNNPEGRQVLEWWRESCLEWCYARVEPGRFGDQKYLDDWPERFSDVYVIQNEGAGAAPWNIQQYRLEFHNGTMSLRTKKQTWPLVFYHFHNVRFLSQTTISLGIYIFSQKVIEYIYLPYLYHLEKLLSLVKEIEEASYDDRIFPNKRNLFSLMLKFFSFFNVLRLPLFVFFNAILKRRNLEEIKGKTKDWRFIIRLLVATSKELKRKR